MRLRSVSERRRFAYAVRIPAAVAALLFWPEHAPLVEERDECRLAAAALSESHIVRGHDDYLRRPHASLSSDAGGGAGAGDILVI